MDTVVCIYGVKAVFSGKLGGSTASDDAIKNIWTYTTYPQYICMAWCLIKRVYRVRFLGALSKLRKALISFVMSSRLSAWNNSVLTGRVFMKSDIWIFLDV